MNKYPYDPLYLIDRIKDDLNGDTTYFNDTWYEFADSVVSVTGIVYEEWDVIEGDYWTQTEYNFISRVADFDEIVYSDKHGERVLTLEEVYYIEGELKKE